MIGWICWMYWQLLGGGTGYCPPPLFGEHVPEWTISSNTTLNCVVTYIDNVCQFCSLLHLFSKSWRFPTDGAAATPDNQPSTSPEVVPSVSDQCFSKKGASTAQGVGLKRSKTSSVNMEQKENVACQTRYVIQQPRQRSSPPLFPLPNLGGNQPTARRSIQGV